MRLPCLRSKKEFLHVRLHGKRWSNGSFLVQMAPQSELSSRFGFIITKKFGGAVARNRARRRLRAVLAALHPLPCVGWWVVLARPGLKSISFLELTADLKTAVANLAERSAKKSIS